MYLSILMFRFVFTGLESSKQMRDLIDFLVLQNLGYPRYNEWVERTEAELTCGYKKAVLALSEGQIVGNVVYQPHKQLSGLLEIKNLRVDAGYRMRHFGAFMLRQVEAENTGFIGAIGDIRPGQEHTLRFMESCGYKTIASIDLYDGQKEMVIAKGFRRNLQNIISQMSLIYPTST